MDAVYSSEFVYHMRFPGLAPGVEGEKQVVRMLHTRWDEVNNRMAPPYV
jgi:hypothetical protein